MMGLVQAFIWAIAVVGPIAGLMRLIYEEDRGRKPEWSVHLGFAVVAVYLLTLVIWVGGGS